MRADERILRINRGGDLNASLDSGRRRSLADIHGIVTSSDKLADLVAKIRACEDKSVRKELKKGLPAAEFNSVCDGLRRIENVEYMTGLIVLDIDDLDSESQAAQVRDNIFSSTMLGCVLAFVSASGHGVKAVLDIGGDRVTADNIKQWYAAAAWYIHSTFSLPVSSLDANACDAVRLCFLSHDPDALLADDGRVSAVDLSWGSLVKNSRPEAAEKVVKVRDSAETDVLAALLSDFAGFCTDNGVCFLREYNTWIGFGANCRSVFNGSTKGMEIWDACSRFSHNYSRRDLVEKWNQLPERSGDVTVVPMLWNFAKSGLDGGTDFRVWLMGRLSKLGLFGRTRVTYN